MVFVWSYLADGDPLYTLVQVATNDLIILIAFAPIVGFLMGLNEVPVPYDTLLLSVVLFVVIPLTAGYLSRRHILRTKGPEWFERQFLPKLNTVSIIGLLLTLILLFSFQGEIILENPLPHSPHSHSADDTDIPHLRNSLRVELALEATPP
ncbi:arsenic resistance protein [Thermococcus peptonophilus]